MFQINVNYKYLWRPLYNFSFSLADYKQLTSKEIVDPNDYFPINTLDGVYSSDITYTKNYYSQENLPSIVSEYARTILSASNDIEYSKITIGTINYNFDNKSQNSIDYIRNYSELKNISILYSKNTENISTSDIWEYLFNNAPLFDIFSILQPYTETGVEMLTLGDLYDYDYSKYIYRASPNLSLILTKLDNPIKVTDPSNKGIILNSLIDIPRALKVYLRDNFDKYLQYAEEKEKNGQKDEMMPEEAFIHPISVKTFLRYARDYQDINFANFGEDKELKVLNNIDVPLFMRWGNVNEMIVQMPEELVDLMNKCITNPNKDIYYIDGANHSYEGKEEELAKQIMAFINKNR